MFKPLSRYGYKYFPCRRLLRLGQDRSHVSHFPHVTPGSLAINANVIFPVQDIRHPTVTVLRMSRVNLIDDPLNQVFLIICWNRLVVKACTIMLNSSACLVILSFFSSLSIIFMRSSRDLEEARFFFKPGNLI